MGRLLDQRPGIDAVFVASDIMAAGALHALRRAGRRVPDDVAVIGFDDLPLAQHTQPPLTTIRQPLERVGAAAAELLLAALDGADDSPTPSCRPPWSPAPPPDAPARPPPRPSGGTGIMRVDTREGQSAPIMTLAS